MTGVGFDLETAEAGQLFTYDLDPVLRPGFNRLAGYIDPINDEIRLTVDMPALIDVLETAPWIYGHGIFNFDLLSLAFWHGANWERLAAKSLDTMILDRLDYPPEARDTGGSEDKYDLDHVCDRRGVTGKTDSIRDLARKHGGYDKIPVDDPDYQAYLRGDVEAIRALICKLPKTPYAKREHRVAAINGRMTLNGFRVDLDLLQKRIDQGEAHKREALEILRDDFDLPLGRFRWHGKGDAKEEIWEDFDNPLQTLEGRKWLVEVYQAFGVRNPPITDKGRLSTSAEVLRPITESSLIHPDLAMILDLMMTVTTTRTVYQTVADHLTGDRVHPLINMGQASGRSSVTSPGLTVFGKRGGRHIEREIFIPEDDYVIGSCDLKQVDMRAIAGLSQDPNYMALFEPGKPDVHEQIAIMITGSASRREELKRIGHGTNYGLGINKMVASGYDPKLVQDFIAWEQSEFPVKCAWRDRMREMARTGQLLDNGFGRKMRANPARAWTQAPALMGQGAAADILKTAMLRISPDLYKFLRLTVHDEIDFVAPKKDWEEVSYEIKKAMTFEWKGVPIECDLSGPGQNWGEVSAK